MVRDDEPLPLTQHLDELRRCLVRGGLAFVILFAAGLVLGDRLMELILLPWQWARAAVIDGGGSDPGSLVIIKPTEGFIFSMKVAGGFALLVGGPFYLRELWSFVGVGLLPRERKAIGRAFPVGVGLFLSGLAFGYFVMLRFALPILVTWVSQDLVEPSITVSEYFSLLVVLTLLMGGLFELPIVMWILVRAGIVERATLARSRRVAVLAMLVFAAIMTPPDPITQILVVLPTFLLYEGGLILAKGAERARDRAGGGSER